MRGLNYDGSFWAYKDGQRPQPPAMDAMPRPARARDDEGLSQQVEQLAELFAGLDPETRAEFLENLREAAADRGRARDTDPERWRGSEYVPLGQEHLPEGEDRRPLARHLKRYARTQDRARRHAMDSARDVIAFEDLFPSARPVRSADSDPFQSSARRWR